ncbi:hypothetical protein [Streptomyces natalensis]|uniref:Uncharacterized protein n=1 Tax=Streptomyces natalensis ATCC 27448 TaxID=1240678 RepID=A0A0D7CC77_9ACTN|nr:hypothetical protein [Streptomyces natalensis]KIZ13854.1 hypothetical protein SNA_32465 [Streptomyces natalensis ATCC 27448]
MRAVVSRWEAGICRSRMLQEPDGARLEAALGELDGAVCTELSVERWEEDGGVLTVSGGPGVFLVAGESGDGSLFQLCRARTAGGDGGPGRRMRPKELGARCLDGGSHGAAEEVWLVCGGQGAYFAAEELVDGATARWAVREFVAGFPGGLGAPWRVE